MIDKNISLQAPSARVGQIAPLNVIDNEVIRASVRQTFAIKAD